MERKTAISFVRLVDGRLAIESEEEIDPMDEFHLFRLRLNIASNMCILEQECGVEWGRKCIERVN